MLIQTGFDIKIEMGDFLGNSFQEENSPRLIFFAMK
jgi:hypothetical protein